MTTSPLFRQQKCKSHGSNLCSSWEFGSPDNVKFHHVGQLYLSCPHLAVVHLPTHLVSVSAGHLHVWWTDEVSNKKFYCNISNGRMWLVQFTIYHCLDLHVPCPLIKESNFCSYLQLTGGCKWQMALICLFLEIRRMVFVTQRTQVWIVCCSLSINVAVCCGLLWPEDALLLVWLTFYWLTFNLWRNRRNGEIYCYCLLPDRKT